MVSPNPKAAHAMAEAKSVDTRSAAVADGYSPTELSPCQADVAASSSSGALAWASLQQSLGRLQHNTLRA